MLGLIIYFTSVDIADTRNGYLFLKHRPVDLTAEIQRASLPRDLEGFLFPMFEAISNALHAIEDRFGDDAPTKGKIRIVFDDEHNRIEVQDNGEGFTLENTKHFLTPYTGNKFKRNGKGFGRFISFKIFDEVFYSSPTEEPKEVFTPAIYQYMPLDLHDNLVEIELTDRIAWHPYDRGLTVSLQCPKESYLPFFDFKSEKKIKDHSELNVVVAILDHFLLEFIQEKTPMNFICEIGGVPFNLTDYFSKSITHKANRAVTLEIDGESFKFDLNFMQIEAAKQKQHSLYFYADNRATSDLENISKGLKENAFEDENGRKYFYLVAATSVFFKSSQSRDRIENLNVKVGAGSKAQTLGAVLAQRAKDLILELEPTYTFHRRTNIRRNVEELIALDPMLRRGLGKKSIEEFVKSRGILETKEQLATDLFIERQRLKFDFRKINATVTYEELQRVVRDNIREESKEALAVYVAYRINVIKILKEMLNRIDGKIAKEDAVHELVYPRYKDSDEIEYAAHNLWLIDDDLAYAEYISSDRTTAGRGRGAGDYAHDLLINNQEELLVVEMKRPQKTSFDSNDEPRNLTDNPVQQLKSQIGQIRDRGRVKTSTGREIVIQPDRMVRAYVLMDWNDKVETYLKDEDFVLSNQGGPMAYKYFDQRNMLVEVLAFDRLADRAAKRNEVFTKILSGQSDHSGKANDPLTVQPSFQKDE